MRSSRLAVGAARRLFNVRSYEGIASFSSNSSPHQENNHQQSNKNFFKKLIGNVQEELAKNKELQESKKALEERLKQLNNSEVRKKFEKIEKDTAESSKALTNKLSEVGTYVNRLLTNIKSTEAAQEALKQAKAAAEALERAAQTVGDTQVYRQVASTAKAVRVEIDTIADVRMYSRPEELRMRSAGFSISSTSRMVEPNTEAQDLQLHKDSKWFASWNSFMESNSYMNKLLDWKMRYDESENVAVRMLRGITDRVSHLLYSNNQVFDVLTEIAKIDPAFNKIEWLTFCEKEVVPNILEAYLRFDLDVLKDWCHERAFNQLATPIKEYTTIGFTAADSHVIDISKMEMVSGKMLEQGPAIVITFQVFMVHVIKNSEGKVVEGDQNNPVRVHHVWVMCRDMEEYNPSVAWKLLEVHMQAGSLSI